MPTFKVAELLENPIREDYPIVATLTEPDKIGMIVTFTDFGSSGPYLGQMKAVLYREAPSVPIVDLLTDAPSCNPKASAYLLAALVEEFDAGTVFLCVVDPGVGGARLPVVVQCQGRWYVGPDNGLFEQLTRHKTYQVWEITWRPVRLSATFHGRDLFAPVAAKLASGVEVNTLGRPAVLTLLGWPEMCAEVIYIDHYGNAMTGLGGGTIQPDWLLKIAGRTILHASRFDQVPFGQAFWYVNSCNLVEIAINQGRADQNLCINIGDSCEFMK